MRGVYEKVKGSNDWYIAYFDADGRRHRQHVGRNSLARAAYEAKKREIRENKFIPPSERNKSGPTFEEVFEQRLANMPGELSADTIRAYRYMLGTKRFDAIRKLPLRKIRVQEIREILNGLYKEKLGDPTVSHYRSLMGSIFAYAVENGLALTNPVLRTRPPKKSKGRTRFLSPDEEQAIREQLRKHWPEREAEFDLLLLTGMRIGELHHLTWAHVHPDRGIIEIPKEGKTGYRPVPMSSGSRKACEILHEQSLGSSYVVPNRYKKRGRRYLALWLGEAAEMAGVDGVTAHVLRHTFASRLVMAGTPVPRVQQYLGHKSMEMTMRYAHLAPEQGTPDIERLVTFGAPAPAAKPPVRAPKAKPAAEIVRIAS